MAPYTLTCVLPTVICAHTSTHTHDLEPLLWSSDILCSQEDTSPQASFSPGSYLTEHTVSPHSAFRLAVISVPLVSGLGRRALTSLSRQLAMLLHTGTEDRPQCRPINVAISGPSAALQAHCPMASRGKAYPTCAQMPGIAALPIWAFDLIQIDTRS